MDVDYFLMAAIAFANYIHAYRTGILEGGYIEFKAIAAFIFIKLGIVFAIFWVLKFCTPYLFLMHPPYYLYFSTTILEDMCFVLPILFFKDARSVACVLVASSLCFCIFHWRNGSSLEFSVITVCIKWYVIPLFYMIARYFGFHNCIMVHYLFDLSVYAIFNN